MGHNFAEILNKSYWYIVMRLKSKVRENIPADLLEVTIPQGNGQSVLVVDDEPHLREIAQQLLESSGYNVTVAAHGEEALTLYKEALEQGDRFDLVILDLGMPVMDGESFLTHLAEIDPSARVLIATGHCVGHAQINTLKAHAQGILLKPFNLDALLREVKNAMPAW